MIEDMTISNLLISVLKTSHTALWFKGHCGTIEWTSGP